MSKGFDVLLIWGGGLLGLAYIVLACWPEIRWAIESLDGEDSGHE